MQRELNPSHVEANKKIPLHHGRGVVIYYPDDMEDIHPDGSVNVGLDGEDIHSLLLPISRKDYALFDGDVTRPATPETESRWIDKEDQVIDAYILFGRSFAALLEGLRLSMLYADTDYPDAKFYWNSEEDLCLMGSTLLAHVKHFQTTIKASMREFANKLGEILLEMNRRIYRVDLLIPPDPTTGARVIDRSNYSLSYKVGIILQENSSHNKIFRACGKMLENVSELMETSMVNYLENRQNWHDKCDGIGIGILSEEWDGKMSAFKTEFANHLVDGLEQFTKDMQWFQQRDEEYNVMQVFKQDIGWEEDSF